MSTPPEAPPGSPPPDDRATRQRAVPAALAPYLLESHLARHGAAGRVVYCTVLLTVAAGAAALPLVHVDVSIQADGIVRPAADKHEVRSGASGFVERTAAREHDRVRAGEPVLLLRPDGAATRETLLAARRAAAERAVHDLVALTRGRGADGPPGALLTARHRAAAARFGGTVREIGLRRDDAARTVERTRALAARQLAAPAELAAAELRLAQADAELAVARERQLGEWQGELAAERATVAELRAEGARLGEERARLVVRAPVSGTVEHVARLAPGSFVQSGDVVAVVSPDLPLVAELHVSPRDVGLVRVGAPVRLQIDAFDYRHWGMAPGRVVAISADYAEVEGRPMFRVRCAIESPQLVHPNGARGAIRKGMTLRARFTVARRSVLQLLHDDASRWLDPVQGGA